VGITQRRNVTSKETTGAIKNPQSKPQAAASEREKRAEGKSQGYVLNNPEKKRTPSDIE